MNRKISAIIHMGRGDAYPKTLELHRKPLKFAPDKVPDYAASPTTDFGWQRFPQKETGKLDIEGSQMDFCETGFRAMVGLTKAQYARLFPINSDCTVRVTIEVIDKQEWEYVK